MTPVFAASLVIGLSGPHPISAIFFHWRPLLLIGESSLLPLSPPLQCLSIAASSIAFPSALHTSPPWDPLALLYHILILLALAVFHFVEDPGHAK